MKKTQRQLHAELVIEEWDEFTGRTADFIYDQLYDLCVI